MIQQKSLSNQPNRNSGKWTGNNPNQLACKWSFCTLEASLWLPVYQLFQLKAVVMKQLVRNVVTIGEFIGNEIS